MNTKLKWCRRQPSHMTKKVSNIESANGRNSIACINLHQYLNIVYLFLYIVSVKDVAWLSAAFNEYALQGSTRWLDKLWVEDFIRGICHKLVHCLSYNYKITSCIINFYQVFNQVQNQYLQSGLTFRIFFYFAVLLLYQLWSVKFGYSEL